MTQQELKNIIVYDAETGIFHWLKNNKIAGGNSHKHGYWRISINKKTYLGHRLAWLYVFGRFPKQLDHINFNKLDNRISNLREITQQQNSQWKSISKNNTSGYKGVVYKPYKDKNFYYARITKDYKKIFIGSFSSKHEAAKAYNLKAIELFGEYAKLNDITEEVL